jgi:protein-disulfide isomerase
MHPHARLASAAALAANEQGKFWQMHDQLFANSRDLSQERILAVARQLGLDMTRFTADLKSPRIEALVNTDLKDGENAAVQGTPAFFINGKLYNGPMEVAKVKPLIEAELRPVNASK